jgi:hypothetical protein
VTSCIALNRIGTRIGWDNKDIPGQRKIPYTYHLLIFGYPIPGFLILGYLFLLWDIQGISQESQKIPLVISLAYP